MHAAIYFCRTSVCRIHLIYCIYVLCLPNAFCYSHNTERKQLERQKGEKKFMLHFLYTRPSREEGSFCAVHIIFYRNRSKRKSGPKRFDSGVIKQRETGVLWTVTVVQNWRENKIYLSRSLCCSVSCMRTKVWPILIQICLPKKETNITAYMIAENYIILSDSSVSYVPAWYIYVLYLCPSVAQPYSYISLCTKFSFTLKLINTLWWAENR